MTIELVSAEDIIQEHKEQEIIQAVIDADSTDEFIEVVVMLVDAGLTKEQVIAYTAMYHAPTSTSRAN